MTDHLIFFLLHSGGYSQGVGDFLLTATIIFGIVFALQIARWARDKIWSRRGGRLRFPNLERVPFMNLQNRGDNDQQGRDNQGFGQDDEEARL